MNLNLDFLKNIEPCDIGRPEKSPHPVLFKLMLLLTRMCFPKVVFISTVKLNAHLKKCENKNSPEIFNKNTLLIDIREKEEYEISHLMSAKWVDYDKPGWKQFEDFLSYLKEKCKTNESFDVIGYCATGLRSAVFLNYAEKKCRRLREERGTPVDIPSVDSFDIVDLILSKVKFYNVEGSLFKWANERLPLVNAQDEATTLVHGNREFWGHNFIDANILYPGPYRSFLA